MRSPVTGLQLDSKFMNHQVSCDWESLLLLGGRDIDLEPTFSRSKVHALKQMVERLPEKSGLAPNTPRTIESNVATRRKLKKFGECAGQENGVSEKFITSDQMPRVKIHWEPKFASAFPDTPRQRRRPDIKIKLVGGVPHANPEEAEVVPKGPRTPRKQIRCRHCDGAHWSHRCPNKIRRQEPRVCERTDNKLSDLPPTEPGPKKKKYKFDFKVRKEGFKRKGNSRWVASPRYTSN